MSLTNEDIKKLSAPLAPSALKERKGQGGKTFTYADLDYLERRMSEVDPDWQIDFREIGNNGIVCAVRVLGVQRSATAGYYIPDTYQVWDNESRSSKERRMNAEVAHTIVTRAQAAAERRAFAMFGLGAELWNPALSDHQAEEEVDHRATTMGETRKTRQVNTDTEPNHNGSLRDGTGTNYKAPNQSQLDYLTDLGVAEAVAKRLNANGSRTNPSQVSQVITSLMNMRRDKDDFADKKATYAEEVVAQVAPSLVSGTQKARKLVPAGVDEDEYQIDED